MILVKSITLNNFLSHKQNKVEFVGGINVIVGENGAGKSSIMEGILYALFGGSARGHLKGKTADLIKKGERQGWVHLELLDENDTYIIHRTISVSSSHVTDTLASARKGPLASSAQAITQEITKIMGLDKDTLMDTVFVKQGEMESVIDNLGKVLEKVANVENITKLRKQGTFRELRKEIQGRLEYFEKITENSKELEKEIEDKESKVVREKIAIDNFSKQLERVTEEREELEKRIVPMKKAREEYISLTGKRDTIRLEIISLLKKYSLDEENLDVGEGMIISKMKDVGNSYAKEKEVLDEQIAKLERAEGVLKLLDELRRESKRLEGNIKEREKKLVELKQKYDKKISLFPNYNKYAELREKARVLEKEYLNFAKEDKMIKELRKRVEQRKINVNNLREKLSGLEKNAQEFNLNLIRAESDRVIQELSNNRTELVRITDAISKLQNTTEGKCPVCGAPMDEEHKKQLLEEYEKKKALLQGNIFRLESEKKELENKMKKGDDFERQIIKVRAEISQAESELSKEEIELSSREKTLKALESNAREYEGIRQELSRLESDYNEYVSVSSVSEEEIKETEMRIEEERREFEEKKNEIVKLEKELQGIERSDIVKLPELKQRKDFLLGKMKEVDNDIDRFTDLFRQYKELIRMINVMNFNEEEYQQTDKQLSELEKRENELKSEIYKRKYLIENEEKEISQLKDKLINTKEEIKEKEVYDKALGKLRKLEDVLSDEKLPAYLKQTVSRILEKKAYMNLSMFDMQFSSLALDERNDYQPLLDKGDGYTIPARNLSGGERVALSLSLRLALASLHNSRVGFVILDEPTVFLDETRKRELLSVILKSREFISQIIVVTHDEEVVEGADSVIKVRNLNGNSEVVREAVA
ncbi:hypothetical protein HS7_10970 [Sulfolobales archaeon HS-7]|nr:hypothetical protein HS7_10970 [Sulfolobales archaeon HS-7]